MTNSDFRYFLRGLHPSAPAPESLTEASAEPSTDALFIRGLRGDPLAVIALEEAGKTGRETDAIGRDFCWQDGRRVPCHAGDEAGKAAAGTPHTGGPLKQAAHDHLRVEHEKDRRAAFADAGRDHRTGEKTGTAARGDGSKRVKTRTPKSKRLASSHKSAGGVIDARVQRHAEAMQATWAHEVGKVAREAQPKEIPGDAPTDVELLVAKAVVGGEMKVVTAKGKRTVRVKAGAMARKLLWLETEPPPKMGVFQLVYDHSEGLPSKPGAAPAFPCYFKRGVGNFSIDNMHKVASATEMVALLRMKENDPGFPEKAKSPTKGTYASFTAEKSQAKRFEMIQGLLAREHDERLRRKLRHEQRRK